MKLITKLLFGLLSVGFLFGLIGLGIVIYISYDLPELNSLSSYNPAIPSKIYSKDGHLLVELKKENRELATIEEIPQRVIDAFLAAEDDNFYNHSGIDYKGIARAMLINLKAGRIKQGASTITQQVAKSILLSSERTYARKIKDLILAKKIEEKFTKNEILFLYLNQVYLGGSYHGVKSAFRGYFDKELGEATTAEIALVAGLLVAPSRYSPYKNPKKAKSRQRYVLGRLFETGKISKEEYEKALKENIKIQIRKPEPMKAGHFTDWIRQRLYDHFGKDEFLKNGYEVVTTIDWELQEKAERQVIEGVKELDKRQGYKGPLGRVEGEEEFLKFITKQREEIYSDTSRFLIFTADGNTDKEFQLQENEVSQLLEKEKEEFEAIDARSKVFLEIGLPENDPFYEFVDFSKNYKAVVTKVSNSQRIIYANFAGMKLMIPYEGFNWAHERKIDSDRHYWSYVTNPETIVKKGDIILVKIDNKKVSLWRYLHKDFKERYKKNKELIAAIKKQRYFYASLDQEPEAEGALLSVSPNTGEIVAMVGGYDFNKSQFNRVVQSNRQPGSAFKPMLFAAGLENYYTPASMLLDSPQALSGVDDGLSWKPRNYDGKFKGSMTFRRALETSRNIPTIKLTQDVGVQKIIDFVDRFKIDVDLPKDLSISLGSFGINLLDLVKMYSIFPNGGRLIKLKSTLSIKDRFGNVHHIDKAPEETPLTDEEIELKKEEDKPQEVAKEEIKEGEEEKLTIQGEAPEEDEGDEEEKVKENPYLVNLDDEQVYDQRLAYIMSNLLKGVVQRGTGRGARDISSFIGGKTGTTNNYVDAWFLGFSSKLVTGVWTGFDNNQTLGWGETGAKSALPIWKEFMRAGIKKFGDVDFYAPSGIVNTAIDVETGRLTTEASNRFIESFVEGTEPGSEGYEEDDGIESNISILESEDYYSNE